MPDDFDPPALIRRDNVLWFLAGLLSGVVLLFLLRRRDSLEKEVRLLKEMNRVLEEERAKVREVLDEGAE
ncbi:MAG: hypothetical protein AB7O62_18400 [Pirellulales bacterium]